MISVQCRVLSREFVRVQHRGIHALPSAHSLSWMTQQSQPLRSKKYGFHKLSATRILKAKSPKSLLVYCDKKMGSFNVDNLVLALECLTRMPSAQLNALGPYEQHTLSLLYQDISNRVQQLQGEHICSVMLASVVLKSMINDRDKLHILQLLPTQTKKQLHQFSPEQMTSVLYAAAALGAGHDCVTAFSQILLEHTPHLSAADHARVAVNLAILERDALNTSLTTSDSATNSTDTDRNRMKEAKNNDTTASRDQSPADVLRPIENSNDSDEISKDIKHLTNVSDSENNLQTVFHKIWKKAIRRVDELPVSEAAGLLAGGLILGRANRSFTHSIVQKLRDNIEINNNQYINKAGSESSNLKEIDEFEQDIELNRQHQEKIIAESQAALASLPPAILVEFAMTLQALSVRGDAVPLLFESLRLRVPEFAKQEGTELWTKLLWTLGAFQASAPTLWMAVGQVTLDKLAVLPDDFEEQKLVESDDNEHIKAVKFTGSQLVAIIWAFAKAKLAHPVLIERVCYRLSPPVLIELDWAQLARLCSALNTLTPAQPDEILTSTFTCIAQEVSRRLTELESNTEEKKQMDHPRAKDLVILVESLQKFCNPSESNEFTQVHSQMAKQMALFSAGARAFAHAKKSRSTSGPKL